MFFLNEGRFKNGTLPSKAEGVLFDSKRFRTSLHKLGVNPLYWVSPCSAPPISDLVEAVWEALENPIGLPKLRKLLRPQTQVLILVDDLTRPTPQRELLPPLLDFLNDCGVPDRNIRILIALGTHRPMTRSEIKARFGKEVVSRVEVINHAFLDSHSLVHLGATSRGTPVVINRLLAEADFSIGCGMVAPHAQFGWSGGAKIVMPGICGRETVEAIHWEIALRPDYLTHAGKLQSPPREEVNEVAVSAGLNSILNVTLNSDQKPVAVVFGHPIAAHNVLVKRATQLFVRPIPERADITVVDARPADLDYWQGLKALTFGFHGVRPQGTLILVGAFPEGVSGTHPDLNKYGTLSQKEIRQRVAAGEIEDKVAAAALLQHARIREFANLICVSRGLAKEAESLGFMPLRSLEEALEYALARHGPTAKVGVLELGGEVVPQPQGG